MAFVPLPLDVRFDREVEGLRIAGWCGPRSLGGGTAFGLVTRPTTVVYPDGDRFVLRPGCWFVAPDGAEVDGEGLAIVVPAYRGLRQLGGPIEPVGRLAYIDGCTDTLLVCPPRLGEPCLSHLHLPAGTDQTEHVHPSVRVGVIVRGEGVCRAGGEQQPLAAGLGFVIPTGCRHAFATGSSSLDVLAWHPDSDFGPTDHDHPMVNRTLRS